MRYLDGANVRMRHRCHLPRLALKPPSTYARAPREDCSDTSDTISAELGALRETVETAA